MEQLTEKSRLYILAYDKERNTLRPVVLNVETGKGINGAMCQVTDRNGNALTGEWNSQWKDFSRHLQAHLNDVYGKGVYYRAYRDYGNSNPVLDNTIAHILARDGKGNKYAGAIDLVDGSAVVMDEKTRELLSRKSYGEEFRKIEEEQRREQQQRQQKEEQLREDEKSRGEGKKAPARDLTSLSLAKKVEGKLIMTAVIGGMAINHEVSQAEVAKMSVQSDDARLKTFSGIFKEVDTSGVKGDMKRLMSETIGQAVTHPGTVAEMPRPEVYATRMESESAAASLRAAATADYSQSMSQEESQSVSRGIGR